MKKDIIVSINEAIIFLNESGLAISENFEVVSKDEVPKKPEPLPSQQAWDFKLI